MGLQDYLIKEGALTVVRRGARRGEMELVR